MRSCSPETFGPNLHFTFYALSLTPHSLHPSLVVQIPLHRLADADLEGVGGRPAELRLDLRGIDGVAAVVAGAVFDVGDEFAGVAAELRSQLVDEVADQLHDVDIGPFIVAADVVGLGVLSAGEDEPEGLGMNVRENALNDDRDELFRELE